MKIAFYILTYNRPAILNKSLQTLFGNAGHNPDEAWIIDDGSSPEMKRGLTSLGIEKNINLLLHGRNYGIGYAFERVYNLMRQDDDLDIGCIIESDYIWRKHWLMDCIDVFNASPHTLAIAGTDHPDMYDRFKTHTTFPEIMKECFGEDLKSREHLYKPFDLTIPNGKIQLQGVSNSCGCTIINWKRLRALMNDMDLNADFWKRMDRAFNKGVTHDTRKNASDGHMSSTLSMYGERHLLKQGVDITKNFPFVSICDFSISEHVCGGGVNGLIAPEGSTFVHSPKWEQKYLTEAPR